MGVLRWKVAASNYLPTTLFSWLSRVYRILALSFSKAPLFRSTLTATAIRIPIGAVNSADEQRITAASDGELSRWSAAFLAHKGQGAEPPINLAWVHKPVGGNFGDWLSPYIMSKITGRRIKHVDLNDRRSQGHVLSLGSIISGANRNSIVLGSGINSLKDDISPGASIRTVRGYITREALSDPASQADVMCCDPGFFLPFLYKPSLVAQSTEKLLIPHINHVEQFESIDAGEFRRVSARVCHPSDIERLIDRIANARVVVTSAMHIFVISCAYSVPCALVKPKSSKVKVPGDGVKYRDCMSPVYRKDFAPQMIDIVPGFRLDCEVQPKQYSLDRVHIEDAYSFFSEAARAL